MMSGARPDQPAERALAATLPRAAKLLKATDFKKVFKENRSSNDHLFRILWRVNDCGGSRLGMAVARKVERSAVGRNRIRRVIRESFRRWRASRPDTDRHYDIVVLPRATASRTANADLARSLERHWRRVEQNEDAGANHATQARRSTRKMN
jgi:ribonuclease P protein component